MNLERLLESDAVFSLLDELVAWRLRDELECCHPDLVESPEDKADAVEYREALRLAHNYFTVSSEHIHE